MTDWNSTAADRLHDRARAAHDAAIASGEHLVAQLGIRTIEVAGVDHAIEITIDPRVTNPQGGLQGGLLATLVDIVAGRAVNDRVGEGAAAVTSDLHVHYLAPVRVGPAVASAKIDRLGRRSAVARVEVHDGHGGPLAAVAITGWAIIRAR